MPVLGGALTVIPRVMRMYADAGARLMYLATLGLSSTSQGPSVTEGWLTTGIPG